MNKSEKRSPSGPKLSASGVLQTVVKILRPKLGVEFIPSLEGWKAVGHNQRHEKGGQRSAENACKAWVVKSFMAQGGRGKPMWEGARTLLGKKGSGPIQSRRGR